MTRLEILQQSRDVCVAQLDTIRQNLIAKSDELKALEFAIKIEAQDDYSEEQINTAIQNNTLPTDVE